MPTSPTSPRDSPHPWLDKGESDRLEDVDLLSSQTNSTGSTERSAEILSHVSSSGVNKSEVKSSPKTSPSPRNLPVVGDPNLPAHQHDGNYLLDPENHHPQPGFRNVSTIGPPISSEQNQNPATGADGPLYFDLHSSHSSIPTVKDGESSGLGFSRMSLLAGLGGLGASGESIREDKDIKQRTPSLQDALDQMESAVRVAGGKSQEKSNVTLEGQDKIVMKTPRRRASRIEDTSGLVSLSSAQRNGNNVPNGTSAPTVNSANALPFATLHQSHSTRLPPRNGVQIIAGSLWILAGILMFWPYTYGYAGEMVWSLLIYLVIKSIMLLPNFIRLVQTASGRTILGGRVDKVDGKGMNKNGVNSGNKDGVNTHGSMKKRGMSGTAGEIVEEADDIRGRKSLKKGGLIDNDDATYCSSSEDEDGSFGFGDSSRLSDLYIGSDGTLSEARDGMGGLGEEWEEGNVSDPNTLLLKRNKISVDNNDPSHLHKHIEEPMHVIIVSIKPDDTDPSAGLTSLVLSSKVDIKKNMVVVLAFDKGKRNFYTNSSLTRDPDQAKLANTLGQKFGNEFRQLYSCFLDDYLIQKSDFEGNNSDSSDPEVEVENLLDEKLRPERWALSQLLHLIHQTQPEKIMNQTKIIQKNGGVLGKNQMKAKFNLTEAGCNPLMRVWKNSNQGISNGNSTSSFVPYDHAHLLGERSQVLALGGLFDGRTGSLLKGTRLLERDGGETSSVGGMDIDGAEDQDAASDRMSMSEVEHAVEHVENGVTVVGEKNDSKNLSPTNIRLVQAFDQSPKEKILLSTISSRRNSTNISGMCMNNSPNSLLDWQTDGRRPWVTFLDSETLVDPRYFTTITDKIKAAVLDCKERSELAAEQSNERRSVLANWTSSESQSSKLGRVERIDGGRSRNMNVIGNNVMGGFGVGDGNAYSLQNEPQPFSSLNNTGEDLPLDKSFRSQRSSHSPIKNYGALGGALGGGLEAIESPTSSQTMSGTTSRSFSDIMPGIYENGEAGGQNSQNNTQNGKELTTRTQTDQNHLLRPLHASPLSSLCSSSTPAYCWTIYQAPALYVRHVDDLPLISRFTSFFLSCCNVSGVDSRSLSSGSPITAHIQLWTKTGYARGSEFLQRAEFVAEKERGMRKARLEKEQQGENGSRNGNGNGINGFNQESGAFSSGNPAQLSTSVNSLRREIMTADVRGFSSYSDSYEKDSSIYERSNASGIEGIDGGVQQGVQQQHDHYSPSIDNANPTITPIYFPALAPAFGSRESFFECVKQSFRGLKRDYVCLGYQCKLVYATEFSNGFSSGVSNGVSNSSSPRDKFSSPKEENLGLSTAFSSVSSNTRRFKAYSNLINDLTFHWLVVLSLLTFFLGCCQIWELGEILRAHFVARTKSGGGLLEALALMVVVLPPFTPFFVGMFLVLRLRRRWTWVYTGVKSARQGIWRIGGNGNMNGENTNGREGMVKNGSEKPNKKDLKRKLALGRGGKSDTNDSDVSVKESGNKGKNRAKVNFQQQRGGIQSAPLSGYQHHNLNGSGAQLSDVFRRIRPTIEDSGVCFDKGEIANYQTLIGWLIELLIWLTFILLLGIPFLVVLWGNDVENSVVGGERMGIGEKRLVYSTSTEGVAGKLEPVLPAGTDAATAGATSDILGHNPAVKRALMTQFFPQEATSSVNVPHTRLNVPHTTSQHTSHASDTSHFSDSTDDQSTPTVIADVPQVVKPVYSDETENSEDSENSEDDDSNRGGDKGKGKYSKYGPRVTDTVTSISPDGEISTSDLNDGAVVNEGGRIVKVDQDGGEGDSQDSQEKNSEREGRKDENSQIHPPNMSNGIEERIQGDRTGVQNTIPRRQTAGHFFSHGAEKDVDGQGIGSGDDHDDHGEEVEPPSEPQTEGRQISKMEQRK